MRQLRSLAIMLLLPLVLLGGCASTNPRDPFEPANRAIYSFNDAVDTMAIRPLAQAYRAVLPSFVRTGISNFFANINDVLIALNNVLQGKIGEAVSDTGRVLVNSTLGVGGLFDVASKLGLEKHNEDFGQTLGYWGIGDGPYLMLPLLGPSSLRDTVGRFVDGRGDPVSLLSNVPWRNSLLGTRTVNQRAELLDTSKILETASLDPYEFLRDGYLQRRRNLIYDGSPPREKDDDASVNKPQTPQRASSPYPVSAEGGSAQAATPLPSGEPLTPARGAAQEDQPPAATGRAAEPRADAALPALGIPAAVDFVSQSQARVARMAAPAIDP